MPAIIVYSSPLCGYCFRAKKLLKKKGVAFEEIDVIADPARREEMRSLAGGSNTVPQIFVDGDHIGGCDELMALDKAGKLDPILGTAA